MLRPIALIAGCSLWIGLCVGGAFAGVKPNGKTAVVLNGLGMYFGAGPMGPIAEQLRAKGYNVEIRAHTYGAYIASSPDVLIGHSMGANAALKAATRLTKKPRVVITIDPGRAPLFHRCPAKVRCVNIHNPWHPIGGQSVVGAQNIVVSGIVHSFMPRAARVQALVMREAVR